MSGVQTIFQTIVPISPEYSGFTVMLGTMPGAIMQVEHDPAKLFARLRDGSLAEVIKAAGLRNNTLTIEGLTEKGVLSQSGPVELHREPLRLGYASDSQAGYYTFARKIGLIGPR